MLTLISRLHWSCPAQIRLRLCWFLPAQNLLQCPPQCLLCLQPSSPASSTKVSQFFSLASTSSLQPIIFSTNTTILCGFALGFQVSSFSNASGSPWLCLQPLILSVHLGLSNYRLCLGSSLPRLHQGSTSLWFHPASSVSMAPPQSSGTLAPPWTLIAVGPPRPPGASVLPDPICSPHRAPLPFALSLSVIYLVSSAKSPSVSSLPRLHRGTSFWLFSGFPPLYLLPPPALPPWFIPPSLSSVHRHSHAPRPPTSLPPQLDLDRMRMRLLGGLSGLNNKDQFVVLLLHYALSVPIPHMLDIRGGIKKINPSMHHNSLSNGSVSILRISES